MLELSLESQFKKSIDKSEKDLEFVATNLHQQTMQVGMVEGRGKGQHKDYLCLYFPSISACRGCDLEGVPTKN